jgi:Flp pilus assembly protein TadG
MKLRETFKLRGLLRNDSGGVQSASIGEGLIELLRSDSSGSALVELALALPAYLIIITGMFSTVMALYSYQSLAFATFTASEVVGAGRGTITDPCATVATNVVSSLPTWNTGNFTYTIWISENGSGSLTKDQYGPYTGTAAATCTGAYNSAGNGNYSLYNAQGEPVTVRVSYVYSWFPIYSNWATTGPLVAAESSYVR